MLLGYVMFYGGTLSYSMLCDAKLWSVMLCYPMLCDGGLGKGNGGGMGREWWGNGGRRKAWGDGWTRWEEGG